MTLDFSSRYSEIFAPITAPVGVNIISRYFPKRLELSLMAVQAFPNASTRGFTWRIFSRKARLLALTEQIQIRMVIKRIYCLPRIQFLLQKHSTPFSCLYGLRYCVNLSTYTTTGPTNWWGTLPQVGRNRFFFLCNCSASEVSYN